MDLRGTLAFIPAARMMHLLRARGLQPGYTKWRHPQAAFLGCQWI